MKWPAGVIAAYVVAVSSATAATAATPKTPVSRATHIRRQLSDCMTRRMAASRTISYNEASKVCKDRLKPPGGGLSASNEGRPANAR